MTFVKYTFVVVLGTVSLLMPFFSLPVSAQGTGFTSDGTYTLLEPLPGFGEGSKTLSRTNLLGRYLENAYTLVLQAAAIICVISIMVGGIQYITAAAADTKSAARNRIWNNFIGFLIVLAAYLILRTINPNLVEFKLEIPKIPDMGGFAKPGQFLIYDETTGTYRPTSQVSGPQSTLPPQTPGEKLAEQIVRQELTDKGIKMGSNVKTAFQPTTVSGLTFIKNECGCEVYLTSGTDGVHSISPTGIDHRSGYKADLRPNIALENYLLTKTTITFVNEKSKDGPYYQATLNNGQKIEMIDEGDHWDIKFPPQQL